MIQAGRTALADECCRLAAAMPVATLRAVAAELYRVADGDWIGARMKATHVLVQPRFRALIEDFLNKWQHEASELSPQSVAFALEAAVAATERHRASASTELVWTGPDVRTIPLRRTDQVLLQVIRSAQRSLLIVSFAVYRIPAVVQALHEAADRHVRVWLCLEPGEASGGHVSVDGLEIMGDDLAGRVSMYVWPPESRPTDALGRTGSLHAKCAVADDDLLFITSANLTEFAMNLNMELGVLVRGGELPGQVRVHFERLVSAGALRCVQS
jgi:phosphatidylserine/phosphatidylglycerophosphate/cardiolipin synthase-like enzyme